MTLLSLDERLQYLCEVLKVTLTIFQYKGRQQNKKPRSQLTRKTSEARVGLEELMVAGGRINSAKEMIARNNKKGENTSTTTQLTVIVIII